ncbi:hypothetical protein WJX81_002382 [Elliptochloris bilobata]|uniref:Uncharacterized protein n=1 Tax=Elliptochloris bilobata TaxID=381761 RepID=A0AAW1QUE5_9CHLO
MAALLLGVSCASATGGRHLLRDAAMAAAPSAAAASAPGPSAGMPPADILFTVSAVSASFASNTLTLMGVAPVALHITAGKTVGATDISAFANTTAGAMFEDSAGQWLAQPVAELVGMADGAAVKALVKLSSPRLSADKSTLTFQATIVSADSAASLPTAGGVIARTGWSILGRPVGWRLGPWLRRWLRVREGLGRPMGQVIGIVQPQNYRYRDGLKVVRFW